MMRTLFFLLIPLSLFSQSPSSKKIDSVMNAYPAFSGVILVADKGKPVYYKSFGFRDYAKHVPLQKTDIFELASVTKQFTAMIIMMLKEKQKLNYDDPVERYLQIPYKGITIRHLLNHTSGLPDYQEVMDKNWDKSKVAGNADCIEYLNKYAPPVLFAPGEQYAYSNTGYLLLASIAEKASGRDFIELSREWIFSKVKMKNTNIRTLAQKAATPNFAIGHIYVKDQSRFVRADSFPSSDYTIWLGNRRGPGRISSTAEDLLKWDQSLYTQKLIKTSTLEDAFTPAKLNNGEYSRYGFGWMLRQDSVAGKVVMHTGDNPGYKTQIIRYTDRRQTIIVLCNNASESFNSIVNGLQAIIRKP